MACLGLSNNKLQVAGAVEIAKNGLEGKTALQKISIENNVIGNEGLKAISLALSNCKTMQEFYLYNNEIDDEPIEEFCALCKNSKDLFAVGLEFNRIGYKGLASILKALQGLTKLEKLYLNQNDINNQAGDCLYDFVTSVKNLKEMRISNNVLEDDAGLRLAEACL